MIEYRVNCPLFLTAAKYHTSKLREFSDLECVPTFGFRGEALSSLCSVSQMTIITKHKTADCATKLEIDHDGNITKKSPVARQTGTSVTIQNLFAKLPVRKIEFRRNIKKEYAKMCTIVQAYGIVSEECRIICSNINDKGVKSVVISTNGGSMRENILNIFGSKQSNDLVEIKTMNEIESTDSLDTTEIKDELTQLAEKGLNLNRVKLKGFVSSCEHGKGRSSKDRQFFYVNARPCEPKNVIKLINEVYRKYNVNQSPFISLNIIIDRADVDVNLTPDKRQVLINNETILLLAIKIALIRTFEGMVGTYRIQNNISLFNSSKSSPSTSSSQNSSQRDKEDDDGSDSDGNESVKEVAPKAGKLQFARMLTQWKQTGDTAKPSSSQAGSGGKRRLNNDPISKFSSKMRKIQEALDADNNNSVRKDRSVTNLSEDDESDQNSDANHSDDKLSRRMSTIACPTPKPVVIFEEKSSDLPSTPIKSQNSIKNYLNTQTRIDCVTDSPKPIRIIEDKPENRIPAKNVSKFTMRLKRTKIILKATIESVRKATEEEDELLEDTAIIQSSLEKLKFKSKILPSANKNAEEELSREITKSSFGRMEIIGQFNLGFIVVRLEDDLFIIDQHASDEKYNFETLQKTTVLQNQKLVIPQRLDLSAPKEILLIDNLEVFKMNGFVFEIDEEAPHTKKVKLLTKPFSQNWQFGTEDIDEILFMLEDAPANSMCRPSRVRAMFASRACRKSVMIGSALSHRDMKRIVTHMGEMEHPWVGILNLKLLFNLLFPITFTTFSLSSYPALSTWSTNNATSDQPEDVAGAKRLNTDCTEDVESTVGGGQNNSR